MIKIFIQKIFLICLSLLALFFFIIDTFINLEITNLVTTNQNLAGYITKIKETTDIHKDISNEINHIKISTKDEISKKFINFFDIHKNDLNLDIKQFITIYELDNKQYLTIKFSGYVYRDNLEKINNFFKINYDNGIININNIEITKDKINFEFSLYENYKKVEGIE